ncbi:hypothetical protein J2R99_000054 [Rhodopseudomonas julia]|uniref:Uncharacterized protein n=1 Tax=Rhodopseudomonas julia TaxID=200617 RepID=A0ABU0C133_9BRAD|nr:hypothetical protein [Rhodopseudomonas julia]MDQ0324205.1 hypothetical protein [Rhodopseudomonas julia]
MSNLEFILLFSLMPVGALAIAVFFFFVSRHQDRPCDRKYSA